MKGVLARRVQTNYGVKMRIVFALGAVLLTACTTGITTTSEGAGVSRVSRAALPPNCQLVGDVAIGIAPDAARPRTEDDLVILMRNKAGDFGASHIVVESSNPRGSGAERYYAGRATAYRCRRADAPPAEEGAGGEATEEGVDGETQPEESEPPPMDSESDQLLDDIMNE